LLRYIYLVLFSILTINEIFAQNNYNETLTFVDPFGKFSIDYPSDWEAIAPGHSFQEGNLDLIIQKTDRIQGYIEIRHEEIISEMKNLTKENDNLISSFLTNNSLEHILHSTFKEYISELHLQNFKHIKEFNYDGSLILDMNTSSILYSFEKDDKVFYGLYIIAKSDYKIFIISYTASTNFFDKNLPKLETMIHSLKFNL
jgi:hypothetical protein